MKARIINQSENPKQKIQIKELFNRLLSDEEYAKKLYDSMADTDDLTERAKGFEQWYEDIKMTAFKIRMRDVQSRTETVKALEKIKEKNKEKKG